MLTITNNSQVFETDRVFSEVEYNRMVVGLAPNYRRGELSGFDNVLFPVNEIGKAKPKEIIRSEGSCISIARLNSCGQLKESAKPEVHEYQITPIENLIDPLSRNINIIGKFVLDESRRGFPKVGLLFWHNYPIRQGDGFMTDYYNELKYTEVSLEHSY